LLICLEIFEFCFFNRPSPPETFVFDLNIPGLGIFGSFFTGAGDKDPFLEFPLELLFDCLLDLGV
jgi:hypothetical protein